MARTKPLKSVVEILRRKLGLRQDEFGERVGLSRRTIQEIEYDGELSWKSARAISDAFNVAEEWLMANDLKAPIVTSTDGRPWNLKNRHPVKKLDDPFLEEAIDQAVTSHALRPLLEDYVKTRKLFVVAAIDDGPHLIARWQAIQDKAWSRFISETPMSKELEKASSARRSLSRADLESIKEDAELVISHTHPLPDKAPAKKAGPKKRNSPSTQRRR